jgi:superfamily II DNA/RNA helicase
VNDSRASQETRALRNGIAPRNESSPREERSSQGRFSQPHMRNSPRQAPRQQAGGGKGARVKQYIDPAKFVRAAEVVEQTEYVPQNRFVDFQVHKRIIANLLDKGYETPTPIQDQTIKFVLEGKDVVGIANTGTGKTAAFSVPLIHDLVTNMDNKMLVMAPTRELAQQIVEEMLSFSKGCGLKIALVIGGASMGMQQKALRAMPRIVVGTPGRIKDHIGQGTLDLSRFNRIVLDEVDRMLDMGFIKDITAILSRTNPDRQSLFFSATMESEVELLIKRFSRNPVTISTKVGATVDSVSQNVVWFSSADDKINKLHDILINGKCAKVIIFDDTKRLVEKLGKELALRGFKVDRIHGNKSQAQRSRAIANLKSGEIDILVATDVAARGIDVSDVSHVINYSQPNTYDDYVHRIGRTGRAGKTGQALTFLQKN